MVVRGYLVTRSGRTLLCERRHCFGERLSVRGPLELRRQRQAVLALGVVTDRWITLLRLPPAAGPSERL